MNLFKIKWSIIWSLFILVLCFLPGKSFPSSNWLDLLQFDKWIHAFLFMMLFLITSFEHFKWNYDKKNIHSTLNWMLLFYCFLLAVGTELIQHFFLADRHGDWLDFIANSVGIIVALFFWKFVKSRFLVKDNEGTV